MSIQITLIRHGETEYNREYRIQGNLDSPLTEEGTRSTEQLGRYLNAVLEDVDAWYVSPLGRTRETSRLIRNEISRIRLPEEEIENRIREISCGDYEGKTDEVLDQEMRERLRVDPHCPYPGGESIADVMERARPFLSDLRKRAESRPDHFHAVCISHGNFNRSFGALLTGLGPHFALRVIQNNTAVNQLISRDRGEYFRVMSWNDTSHIKLNL